MSYLAAARNRDVIPAADKVVGLGLEILRAGNRFEETRPDERMEGGAFPFVQAHAQP